MNMRICGGNRILRSALVALVGSIGLVGIGQAVAQESMDQDVSPNTSVADRFGQTFGADGVPAGGFTLFPSVNVAAVLDDNIFGSVGAKSDDIIIDLTGGARLRSNWSVHNLELFSTVRRRQYLDHDDESTTDYAFGANGRIDITGRTALALRGSHGMATESRRAVQTAIDPTDPTASAATPVRFTTTIAGADLDIRQSRFRETIGGAFRKIDYDNVDLDDLSGVIDQDFRDREVLTAYARQYVRVRPTVEMFAQVDGEWQTYDSPQPGTGIFQDSSGYGISGGIAFDINKVARGEIGVGYQSRDYDDPSFSDISGVNVDATLEYFMSDLTTLTLGFDRTIRDSAIPGVAGYYSTGVAAKVEHELFRPILLVLDGTYRSDDFQGLARTDKLLRLSGGIDYAFRREVIFSLRYIYLDVSSTGPRGDFSENVVRFGLEFRL